MKTYKQTIGTTEIYSHALDDYLFNHIDTLNDKLKQKEKLMKKQSVSVKSHNKTPKEINSDLLGKIINLGSDKLSKLIALAEVI